LLEEAYLKVVQRLVDKGRISPKRQNFYLIIPPEYATRQTLPLGFFVDNLIKFLDRNYYVGLLTAAMNHGAATVLSELILEYNFGFKLRFRKFYELFFLFIRKIPEAINFNLFRRNLFGLSVLLFVRFNPFCKSVTLILRSDNRK